MRLHRDRADPTTRRPFRRARRSDPAGDCRAAAGRGRAQRRRGRGALCHQRTGDHAAPAGIGAGRPDRAPGRAAMAFCARARRGADAGRGLAFAPAAALDGGAGSARGTGRGANSEAEEVMTEPDETTLRLERLIPSPPEMLFVLFVEPCPLLRWWAPDGYEPSIDALDASPGGRWRTVLRRPDGGAGATSGGYRVREPPRRLVFTWAWEDHSGARGHESEVMVSFEPVPGGTRLVLVQQRFESRPARDNHNRGWAARL